VAPRFFIERPVFAWVIALGILLSGLIALRRLPIEQYPSIAPPSLTIAVAYPGADASVLETNVTQVIEQELNGVDGFLYMSSSSQSNGTASINVTFNAGTDINVAQMEVQNRLRRVEPRLPEEVRRQGVQVLKAFSNFLLIVVINSKSGRTATLELGNFATTRVMDDLRRIRGVGDVQGFSSQYAMRIWLDPDKLALFKLSAADALTAVREQNSQSAAGSLGDQPLAKGVELNATIQTQSRFSTPEQFAAIVLRANSDGSIVRLGDVARVELGAQDYLMGLELNGKPAAGLAVQLAPGANALDTAKNIRARLSELEAGFPQDIGWSIPYDSAPFVAISIREVIKTLAEAMILVFVVMFLFLQNLRATLIPTIVVPISLAGACLGLWAFGFSINVLSLFGMVLAIGILVDDAIVVVENVERIMRTEGLQPYEATVKAMTQITSAIIGITLALVAVFVPMAFFPGTTGGIYRQFATTLTLSIAFSALLALTLTPALCAALLKPHALAASDLKRPIYSPRGFLARFNEWIDRTTNKYQLCVGQILIRPVRFLLIFVALVGATAWLFSRLAGSFVPTEDQGYVLNVVQAPPGATSERTTEAVEQVKAFYNSQPKVLDTVFVHGFSFFGQGQANAMSFVTLQPWDQRQGSENTADALAANANQAFSKIKQALAFALNPPPISELGVAGGFTLKLEDRAGLGSQALLDARNKLLGAASQSPLLTGVRPESQDDAPQLSISVDRIKARALGLEIGDINTALAISFASAYANDFSRDGRIMRVLLQADAEHRMTPQHLLNLSVRNERGEMVPFGAFTKVEWTAGAPQRDRYNGYPATTISGSPALGRSTGEAMDEMEKLVKELPEGFGFEWTGISYEEKQSAGQVGALLTFSLIVVYLLLAALYESWSVPISVLLVVPLGVLGSVLFTMGRGLAADVYFNVGLIAIIGLAAKNAILIVEFAIEEEAEGKSVFEATMNAVRLRLRPVVMTSLSFILGMLPLVTSSGAGAASRIAVGTGVMGGMIAATLLGIFFIPLFYLSVRRWIARRRPPAPGETKHAHAQ
jgi:multidrug efflux pump